MRRLFWVMGFLCFTATLLGQRDAFPDIFFPKRARLERVIQESDYLRRFDHVTGFAASVANKRLSFGQLLERLEQDVGRYRNHLEANGEYDKDRFGHFQIYLGIALSKWLGPRTFRQFSEWANTILREQERKVPRYLVVIPPERSSKHRFER